MEFNTMHLSNEAIQTERISKKENGVKIEDRIKYALRTNHVPP